MHMCVCVVIAMKHAVVDWLNEGIAVLYLQVMCASICLRNDAAARLLADMGSFTY